MLLSITMGLTRPAQSVAFVQSAEAQKTENDLLTECDEGTPAEESMSASYSIEEIVSGIETDIVLESESILLETEDVKEQTETKETVSETTVPVTDIESTGEIDTATEESQIESESETIQEDITEETTQIVQTENETTQEEITEIVQTENETTQEDTMQITQTETETEEEATQELLLKALEKKDIVVLYANQKESFILTKDKESNWFSFTPEIDGVYALKVNCYGLKRGNFECRTNGLNKVFYNNSKNDEEDGVYEILFKAKAEEKIHIQPYIYDEIWEDHDVTEIEGCIEIQLAEKGMVEPGDDGKYILSYNEEMVELRLSVSSKSIYYTAMPVLDDEKSYYIGAYSTDICNNYCKGYLGGEEYYSDSFVGLDNNTKYHLEYVMWVYDDERGEYRLAASFDGTDMPFDVLTNQSNVLIPNQKEPFILRRGEENEAYFFTPEKDDIYVLRLNYYGLDEEYGFSYRINGANQIFYNDNNEEKYMYGIPFKAEEKVQIQPYVYDYIWDDYEITEVEGYIEILSAEKGTVVLDNNGKYMLSYNEEKIELDLSTSNTSIYYTAVSKDTETDKDYYISIYNTDTSDYCEGHLSNDYKYSNCFAGLDINSTYHLEYALWMYHDEMEQYRLEALFDGTGMPFDVSTKQPDKIGGELHVTADFGTVVVNYELFRADTAGDGGYIRYRKDTEETWIYEQVSDYEEGRIRINADSDTLYQIELVSRDKETIYDSAEITTEKYSGSVKTTILEDSITSTSIVLQVTGFDTTKIDRIEVQTEYTNSLGESCTNTKSYSRTEIETGIVDYTLRNLEAETVYENIKVRIDAMSYKSDEWNRQVIYLGLVSSFTTKESSIRQENIHFEVIPEHTYTNIKVIIDGILQDTSKEFYSEYRRKGTIDWEVLGKCQLTSTANTETFQQKNLEPYTDYEIKYYIDGIAGIYEFQYTPIVFDGSVKPEVKVVNTYANGLEVECSLNGTVDNNDKYIGKFEVCYDETRGRWASISPRQIVLSGTDTIKQQIYGEYVHPGQKQKWRYKVYKNDLEYYVEYFESETKPIVLELDTLLGNVSRIYGSCTLQNWAEVVKNKEEARSEISIQFRRKGQEVWKKLQSYNLRFNSEKCADFSIYLEDLKLKPFTEYELRMVGYGDDTIVYGQSSFIVGSTWDVSASQTFIYNQRDNIRCISIYNNFGKPTVKVENESIVSVKEIRQACIYLNIHNLGKTKLFITADGIKKEITVNVSVPLKQELYYLEGADMTLADIALPKNITWVDDEESPKADNENKIQYFDVQMKEGDTIKYGTVPVAVGKLGSIDIQGRSTVQRNKENIYSVNYNSVGSDVRYYAKGKAYEITQQWIGNKNLKILSNDKERNVTVKSSDTGGEYELRLTVTVKNLSSGNSCTIETEKKIRIIDEGLIDNLILRPAKEQPSDTVPFAVTGNVVSGTIIRVDYEQPYNSNQNPKIQMEAKTDTGAAGIQDVDVDWQNENTDILEVNSAGFVTIKGNGEGKICVSAKDNGRYSENLTFIVNEDAPVFDTTSIIVKQGNKEGTLISFTPQKKNYVTKIKLMEENSPLEINRKYTYSWYLRTKKDSTFSEETIEHITLELTTENEKRYYQTLDVTVLPKPTADKTTAEFKQTVKPNLFYLDSEAVFSVNSNYKIEDIRTIDSDKDKANFHVKQYDAATGNLVLIPNKLSKETVADYAKKNSPNAVANVEIKFSGFDAYVAFQNIKVSVQNKAVTMKAEDAIVTEKTESASVTVLSGKNVYDISNSVVEIVSVNPASQKENFQSTVEAGRLLLTYHGTGTARYKLKVKNPNWAKDINLSGKISKVNVSKLSLKATATKAILNTKYQEMIQTGFSVKGNDSLPVILKYECIPQTDGLKIETLENKLITVSAAQDKTVAPGKYKLKIWGEIDTAKTKASNLTITVTDKEPAIKLSAKGSINIANRDFSEMIYTATIKNTDAVLSKVEIADRNVLRFGVKKEDCKKFAIKALKSAKDIEKNKKYPVKIRISLSNGYVCDMTATIKPINKLPKIKVIAPKNPVISRNTKNPIKITLTPENGYEVQRVVLVEQKGSENFWLSMNEQNIIIFGVAKNSSVLTEKSITLKYQIYITGADNSKPMTKNLKISITD